MAHWTDDYTFVFGAPRHREVGFVALIADRDADAKLELSVPIVWASGQWHGTSRLTLDFSVCGLTIVEEPIRQGAYLSLSGHVYFVGSNDEHEEYIRTATGEPQNLGMMRSIRSIRGKAYAVGMQRQAYRREGRESWVDLSQAIRPAPGSNVITSFEGIDGFDANELYACGRDGEIWWYDGSQWHQVDSPTNVNLTNVVCAGDGNVYVCGRQGMLLRGRRDRWEILEQEEMTQDIWSLAWFKDRLFAASMNLVLELKDGVLEPVAFDGDFPTTAFHLAVALDRSVMWSTGAKDLFSFDGTQWTRID